MSREKKCEGRLVVIIPSVVLKTFPKIVGSPDVHGTPSLREEVDARVWNLFGKISDGMLGTGKKRVALIFDATNNFIEWIGHHFSFWRTYA